MATAAAEAAPPPAKGKKKLILIIAAVALLLIIGGVAALLMLRGNPEAEENLDADSAEDAPAVATQKADKTAPIFVPLDMFTINLADRDAERYAQIGITLQVADAKVGDQMKLYMPAIRNNILMLISEHTAAELLDRDGKRKLADRVVLETSRALGHRIPDAGAANSEDPETARRARRTIAELPIRAVMFSNFIVQ